ncbi:MAG: beta-ketoacyl-ACP synthase II [Opitutales bacterium]
MTTEAPSAIRVVVTGMGAVTPLGTGRDKFWQGLLEGRSGIVGIDRFNLEGFACKVAGQVDDFDAGDWMDFKEAKRNDRYTHLAVAAARMAYEDAGLNKDAVDPERFGVIIGSGIGGMKSIEEQSRTLFDRGPRKISPFMIPMIILNMASGVVAIELGARGPNFSPVSACASGAHAIGEAMRKIQAGETDVMLAGGTEASVTELGIAGFCAMRAMSTRYNDTPDKASRPFDASRDGFVMGEGSGLLLIESEAHAKARGARIYCELSGYGATCDAFHITSPDPDGKGLARCLQLALDEAGETIEGIDYINAHGTSTPLNDKFETLAIKKVFGSRAQDMAVSSTKSMTGHLLGAAGGIEAIVAAMAVHDQVAPPTINYTEPDPDCDLDYVPNQKRPMPIRAAISNNLGFGGHNACLLFKQYG